MRDAAFFTHPCFDWQRRYEALRASFVERLAAKVVADRFGYSPGYVRLLRHQFRHGKLDLSEPVPEGKAARPSVSAKVRRTICEYRNHRLSAGEIAELLVEDGVEISVRTVERVLAEEGFPKLPRRIRLKLGRTVKGAQVPQRAEVRSLVQLDGASFESTSAGIWLFAPLLARFDTAKLVKAASLPGTKAIGALNYWLSFLALKLLGTERYAHVGEHSFDPALGWFAGLNVLPKCTAMSTHSYSLDELHLSKLQQGFVKRAAKLGLYDGSIINLDYHSAPHFGDESVLDKHWTGARGKKMKGALTLFAQDAGTKLMLYTDADVRASEADDQVMSFLSFWQRIKRGVKPTFVFDSRFTSYANLLKLDVMGVRFITLRRRGPKMLQGLDKLGPWQRIHIPHAKRKYRNPLVYESKFKPRGYYASLRQVIMRSTGHEKPTFLITNDFDAPLELLVGNYARRWRVENGIAEAVKFFHLNALSSPILTKIHFDVLMTVVADTLYHMLAQKLRGFEECDAPTLYRHFVRGKGTVSVRSDEVTVTYPRRAHNPILRKVPWHRLPDAVPGMPGARLKLRFK
jgi:transposase